MLKWKASLLGQPDGTTGKDALLSAPADLTLIPRTHWNMEGENQLHKADLRPPHGLPLWQ